MKVQHRDIDEIVRLDLKTIRRIMAIVQWFVPVQGLDAYYHQIRSMSRQELDFAREARQHRAHRRRTSRRTRAVRFPRPVRELSTQPRAHHDVRRRQEGRRPRGARRDWASIARSSRSRSCASTAR